jgi:hypothetical protein
VHEHEADVYGQTIEGGGVVISVRVPSNEVAHATAVLNIIARSTCTTAR